MNLVRQGVKTMQMGKKKKRVLACLLGIAGFLSGQIKEAHLRDNWWYPSGRQELEKKLNDMDVQASQIYGAKVESVRALIVPHAGLPYSGHLAAGCFRLLDSHKVRRIILLAPSHHVPYEGIILPPYSVYRLSSGVLPVDSKMVQELKKIGKPFKTLPKKRDPHYTEHALEVELPLVQKYAPHAKIVPLIVGTLDAAQLQLAAQTLKNYIDKETVIVVSSDFTHYGPRFNNLPFKNDELALLKIRSLDNELLQPIFNRSLSGFLEKVTEVNATLCGKNPLSLLLALFEQGFCKDEAPYLIGYDTSRSKGKDIKNSVSYVGLVFGKSHPGPVPTLTAYEKRSLLELAHATMENSFTKAVASDLLRPIITPGLLQPVDLFLGYKKKSDQLFVFNKKSQAVRSPLYVAVIDQATQIATTYQGSQTTKLSELDLKISAGLKKSEHPFLKMTAATDVQRYSTLQFA